MIKISNNQRGYVILMVTFSVMIIMLTMAMAMSFLTVNRQKNITNTVKSTQSYYAAEAGIEDALLRLKKNPEMSVASYNFNVNSAVVSVIIPSIIGGSKAIISRGDYGGMIRSIQTVVSMSNSGNATFYYGIQVGALGLQVGNNSIIDGNVFSDGNISGGGTASVINYNAIVNGNCAGLTIKKDLTFTKSGTTNSCTVDGTTLTDTSQSATTLPISSQQISDWKSDASATDNIINGDKNLTGNASLGPAKIIGNLNIGNNMLTLTGTVYVTGNITFGNNGGGIKLDSIIYQNAAGGIIILDGQFIGGNMNNFSSAGTGSYLLILSTYTSPNLSDPAITVGNNMTGSGAAFYTNSGVVSVPNGGAISEITGIGITTGNNSTITTSSGIVNIYFASGPSAGWEVTSWQEQ